MTQSQSVLAKGSWRPWCQTNPPALWPQLLIIIAVGAALYGHTLQAPWYFDDISAILGNGSIRSLATAFRGIFARRGLTELTFAVNFLSGGTTSTLGFHLVNIAIHLATAILVLLLLRRVFPDRPWYPLLGSLLFVCHPIQTQAVTYVAQRMTSLSALCVLLSLYLFVRGREELAQGSDWRSPRYLGCYLGSLGAGLLAVMAKENAVILPLLLLLFARCFLPAAQAGWRPLLAAIAPFAIAPLIYVLIYFFLPILHEGVAIEVLGAPSRLVSLQGNSPLHYLFTEFSVLWIYIRLLFFPYGQALDHGYPVVRELLTVQNLVAFAGLLGLGLLAFRLRRTQPALSAGIAWFFLALAVESSIIPLDPLYEHRLYLPMFGFVLVLLALVDLIPRRKFRDALLSGLLLVLALLTWQRNDLWNDPIAFYRDNLRIAPDNERVYRDLAIALLADNRLDEAEPLLRHAVQINPRLVKGPYASLADAYFTAGRDSDARRVLEEGIRHYPDDGVLLNNLAVLCSRSGEEARAFELVSRGLAIKPTYGRLYISLGKLLLDRGDAVGAEQALRQGISLGYASDEARYALTQAMLRRGSSGNVR